MKAIDRVGQIAVSGEPLPLSRDTPRRGGQAPVQAQVPMFSEAAASVRDLMIHYRVSGTRGADDWYCSLERHVLPHMGSRPVSDIGPRDVLAVLQRIRTEKPATARKTQLAIRRVMHFAMALDLRTDKPADADVVLRRLRKSVQLWRVPHHEVAGVLAAVRGSKARISVRLAFEFLVLTATQSREVRGARWDQIDLEAAVWTIAAERMTSRRTPRAPLSTHALAVLIQARELGDGSGFVFPNKSGRPISSSLLPKLLDTLGIEASPHAFRTSFRDWCANTGVHREVAEACLGHRSSDGVAVFCRSDVLEPRRKVMDDWGAYLCGAPSSGVMGG